MTFYPPKYAKHTSLWVLKSNCEAIDDILTVLRKKDKRWSFAKVANVAMYKFVRDLPRTNDKQLKELFDEYSEVVDSYKHEKEEK